MIETPEHDKLIALRGENQIIGNFIEWLGEQGYVICEHNTRSGWGESDYFPTHRNRNVLLASYFGIDQNKLEDEKVAMLDENRRLNSPT